MKRFGTGLLLAVLLFGAVLPVRGGGDLDSLRGLKMRNAKIPIYNAPERERDNRILQLMVFFRYADRVERLLRGTNVLLDVIRRNSDVDVIMDSWFDKVPYPLKARLKDVSAFWTPSRNAYSDGIVFSPTCEIDIEQRCATGNNDVYFRSPQLDIDGLGYRVDFSRRTLVVNSDVRIVVREEESDPRKFAPGAILPLKQQFVEASGDSMLIDVDRSQAMLIGNVILLEARGKLECDRLTIFIDRKGGADKKNEVPDANVLSSGISRVLADGNVTVYGERVPGEKPARAHSDHMEYDMKRGELLLTCQTDRPRVISADGETAEADRIIISRNDRRVLALGNCIVESKEGDIVRRAYCDRGVFDMNANRGEMQGNVRIVDPQMTLESQSLLVFLTPKGGKNGLSAAVGGLERIESPGPLTISTKEKLPGKGAGKLTAQQGEFNYASGVVTFIGKVHGSDDLSSLDCDKLELFLGDSKTAKTTGIKRLDSSPFFGGRAGGSKRLDHAVASGSVVLTDPRAKLTTEKLSLLFQEVRPGEVKKPGMFQSGDSRLIAVIAENGLHAESLASSSDDLKEPTRPGLLSGGTGTRQLNSLKGSMDLLKNTSEFHGNVVISDAENRVSCQDMYLAAVPASKNDPVKGKPADPDDDPFALPNASMVPSRLLFGDGLELQYVICEKEVQMERLGENGEAQQAGGDRCVYTVADQMVVLSAQPPARPWLRGSGMKQTSDKILFDVEKGIFTSQGRTVTTREN